MGVERVTVAGRTITYRATGSGPLYVHGSGGSRQVWAAQYGRGGAGGVALDLSGHGDSDPLDGADAADPIDAHAAEVAAVAGATGPSVVVGHSLGGAAVLRAVLDHSLAPTALVLCGCGARFPTARSILETVTDDFEAAIERFHRPDALFHAAGARIRRRSRTRLRTAGQATLARDLRACAAFDVRDRLAAIEPPTLAITGVHDRLTPVEGHRRLAAGLPAGRTATVGAAAHLAFVERPAAWRRIVDAFRRTVVPTTS